MNIRLPNWMSLAALWLFLTLPSAAAAKPCSDAELRALQTAPNSCAEAELRIKHFGECDVENQDRRDTVSARLAFNKANCGSKGATAPAPKQDCAGAAEKLTALEAEKPSTCWGQSARLARARQLAPCLAEAALVPFEAAVETCSCAAFANESKPPTDCQAAERSVAGASLWRQCRAKRAAVASFVGSAQAFVKQHCSSEPTLRQRFEQAKQLLEQTNQRIADEPTCAVATNCTDLRREQLERLALYLDYFALTDVPTEADQAEAREHLTRIGIPANGYLYVARCAQDPKRCSTEDVSAALEIWAVFGDDALRGRLQAQAKQKPEVLEALEALRSQMARGADAATISEAIKALPPLGRELIRRVFYEGRPQAINYDSWRVRHEKELRRIEVVTASPPSAQECSPFIDAALRGLTGEPSIRAPTSVTMQRYRATIEGRVKARSERCRVARPGAASGAVPPVGELGCGAVIGIRAEPVAGRPRIRAEAQIVFVVPGGTRTEHIDMGELSSDPEEQRAKADHLVGRLQMTFDNVSFGVVSTVVEADHESCGIAFKPRDPPPVLPPPSRPGISVGQRDWTFGSQERVWFESGLMPTLARQENWVGPAPAAQAKVAIETATVRAGDLHTVELTLKSTQGQAPRTLYRFAIVVDVGRDCSDEPLVASLASRWQYAGMMAAARISDYFKSVPLPVPQAKVSRYLLPGAEWWKAEQPAKRVGGIAWSVGDVGLLGGGVALVGLSIRERNAYARREGSLDYATDLQYAGFALLGGFLVERVLWAALGTDATSW